MSKERFVTDTFLLPKLPAFLCGSSISSEKLDKLIDRIEEEVILKKAKEIEAKRKKEDVFRNSQS